MYRLNTVIDEQIVSLLTFCIMRIFKLNRISTIQTNFKSESIDPALTVEKHITKHLLTCWL